MFALHPARLLARTSPSSTIRRCISTLPSNPSIYIHPHPQSPSKYLLTLTPTTPPIPSLAIGTTTAIPPTPDSLVENAEFLKLMHYTVGQYAHEDPDVKAQAAMYISSSGSTLGSGGFNPNTRRSSRTKSMSKTKLNTSATGAGGASGQGGMGGANRGGYIHVSDSRNPPDFGRVAWPEDILGSLELDGEGKFVGGDGRYSEAGTYRVVTREGVLGLSGFLMGKVRGAVEGLEAKVGKGSG
ncbi:hypothetical protein LTR56_002253 [Elasticomyces elasticus]|nr:hypothetical protein LTR56_002253 [Elasticomyces elasticus]KAK3666130.1 hypothetical protein LTR22_003136 [Elasticomyces elasticus]KAK4929617.1 hypothetical protein LTR49_003915 [Elasticomyces elasticus]KAK5767426.1 hypothetical protein LTS12_002264 [Elasticomyces elasticus]